MAVPFWNLVFFTGILAALAFTGGCIAISVGDVIYSGGNLTFTLQNTGSPADAFVQVTAYHVSLFSQEEYLYVSRPVSLVTGTNSIIVPANLRPGTYKLYIYVIQDGVRKAAVIRDIGV